MGSFGEFRRRLGEYAVRPCIQGIGRAHTYGQLSGAMLTWQARWDAMGVGPGSVIGLRADYSFAAISALLSLLVRGAIVALIPRDRSAEEYLNDARAGGILAIDLEGGYEYRHLGRPPEVHPLLEQLKLEGGAGLIVFTSGSTGRPKAALHSLERFLLKFQKPGRALRTLAFLLFDHIAGLDTLFYTLSNGGSIVVPQRRDPQAILELIALHRVQVLPASPSFLRMLCLLENDPSRDLSSLEVVTYGSEPMDSRTLQRVNERFPNAKVIQKYGTTEVGSPRTTSRGSDSLWLRIKSGRDMEVKVEDGVLWLRTRSAMLGYLNAPSPVDENGWYRTGDLVDVDGEWVRFLGRVDETMKVGGEKVSPAEVERVIRELDFVRDVVASGEPHPLLGQVVAARVAIDPGRSDSRTVPARIRQYCRERLPSHYVPVRIEIEAGDTLNLLTPRQKTRRGIVASND